LIGDLTNQNAECTTLSDKQDKRISRLTSVDLNLKIGVFLRFPWLKQQLMFIHVYLVL